MSSHSSREGSRHFRYQRWTALANIPVLLFVTGIVVVLVGQGHAVVRTMLASPVIAIPLMLFIAIASFHMYLGMQVVIDDYVHGGTRRLLLVVNGFFCLAIAILGAVALVRLSFGAF